MMRLVICQGILQYLDARQARRAIAKLARLTRGALYLEVLTKADWQHNCDQTITDDQVFLRPGSWYRQVGTPHFVNYGGGLFVPKDSDVVSFELEALA